MKFPFKSICTRTPVVQKIEDSALVDIFNETSFLYDIDKHSEYQIKIDLGQNEPIYENPIEIIANIPKNIVNDENLDRIRLFALIYQNGGYEIIDHFEIIPSEINTTNQTITAQLPYWIFTNARNGNYETYLIITSFNRSNFLKASDSSGDSCLIKAIYPTNIHSVTSHFNLNRLHPTEKNIKPHFGTDFSAPVGTPVFAVASGVVKEVGVQICRDCTKCRIGDTIGWGKYILIEHDNPRLYTLYAHLSEFLVARGNSVTKGQLIAKSGNTGIGTGPHLHVEFRQDPSLRKGEGSPIDQYQCMQTPLFEVNPEELLFAYQDNAKTFTIRLSTLYEIEEVKSLNENICTAQSSIFVQTQGDTMVYAINVFPKNNINPNERNTNIEISAKIGDKVEKRFVPIIQEAMPSYSYRFYIDVDLMIDSIITHYSSDVFLYPDGSAYMPEFRWTVLGWGVYWSSYFAFCLSTTYEEAGIENPNIWGWDNSLRIYLYTTPTSTPEIGEVREGTIDFMGYSVMWGNVGLRHYGGTFTLTRIE